MSSSTKRVHRVEAHITRKIATILQRKIKDPRLEAVTITGSKISNDLSVARIYFVINGVSPDQEHTAYTDAKKGLESAAGFIKRELGHTLDMKRIPHLVFFPDTSLSHGARVESLLQEIHQTSFPQKDEKDLEKEI